MEHIPFRNPSINVEHFVNSGRDLITPSKLLRCPTEPRNTQELLQSPLHRKINFKSPSKISKPKLPPFAATKNITQCSSLMPEIQHSVSLPRHTMELLKSPLHKNVSPLSTSKIPVTPDASQQKREERLPNRKIDFSKEALRKIEDRIVTYLEQETSFRSIPKRGLRKISVNDFVKVLRHLLAFTGARVKPMDTKNYIDQTICVMQLLRYPHKVNKSWLLLPSAFVHHWIPMFDFLLDFSPTENGNWLCELDFYRKEHDSPTVPHCSSIFQRKDKFETGSDSVEGSATLEQELQLLELELLDQKQTIDLLEQQLRSMFDEETILQAKLDKCQLKLDALSQQCQQHDQQMGQVCLEIWRKNNDKEQLQSKH